MAISRGGLVPAVMLSHYLDVRDLRVLTVVHTVDDGCMRPRPVLLASAVRSGWVAGP